MAGGRISPGLLFSMGSMMSPVTSTSSAFQIFNLAEGGSNYSNTGGGSSSNASTLTVTNGTGKLRQILWYEYWFWYEHRDSIQAHQAVAVQTPQTAQVVERIPIRHLSGTNTNTGTNNSSGTNTATTGGTTTDGSFTQTGGSTGSGTNTGTSSGSGTNTVQTATQALTPIRHDFWHEHRVQTPAQAQILAQTTALMAITARRHRPKAAVAITAADFRRLQQQPPNPEPKCHQHNQPNRRQTLRKNPQPRLQRLR